jgi:hypothetical protein
LELEPDNAAADGPGPAAITVAEAQAAQAAAAAPLPTRTVFSREDINAIGNTIRRMIRQGWQPAQIMNSAAYRHFAQNDGLKAYVDKLIGAHIRRTGVHRRVTAADPYAEVPLGDFGKRPLVRAGLSGLKHYGNRQQTVGFRPHISNTFNQQLLSNFQNRRMPKLNKRLANKNAFIDGEGWKTLGRRAHEFKYLLRDLDNNTATPDDFIVIDPSGGIRAINGYSMVKLGEPYERQRLYLDKNYTSALRHQEKFADWLDTYKLENPKNLNAAQAWNRYVVTPFFQNAGIKSGGKDDRGYDVPKSGGSKPAQGSKPAHDYSSLSGLVLPSSLTPGGHI